MNARITRFAVLPTSKTLALVYFLMGILFIPLFLVVESVAPPEERLGTGLWLIMPVVYAAIGFLVTALMCALYNFAARLLGGVHLALEAEAPAPATNQAGILE